MFATADLDTLRTMVAPDVVDHDPVPGQPAGVEGIVQVVSALHAGVPDQTFTVSHVFAEDDLVSARWTSRGVNTGPLFGRPPTGEVVEHTAVVILRLADGRITERWAGVSPTRPPGRPDAPAADRPTVAHAFAELMNRHDPDLPSPASP